MALSLSNGPMINSTGNLRLRDFRLRPTVELWYRRNASHSIIRRSITQSQQQQQHGQLELLMQPQPHPKAKRRTMFWWMTSVFSYPVIYYAFQCAWTSHTNVQAYVHHTNLRYVLALPRALCNSSKNTGITVILLECIVLMKAARVTRFFV